MTELFKNLVNNNTFGELDKQERAQERQQETKRRPMQPKHIDSPFVDLVHQARARERADRERQERARLRDYNSLKNKTKRVIDYLFDL